MLYGHESNQYAGLFEYWMLVQIVCLRDYPLGSTGGSIGLYQWTEPCNPMNFGWFPEYDRRT